MFCDWSYFMIITDIPVKLKAKWDSIEYGYGFGRPSVKALIPALSGSLGLTLFIKSIDPQGLPINAMQIFLLFLHGACVPSRFYTLGLESHVIKYNWLGWSTWFIMFAFSILISSWALSDLIDEEQCSNVDEPGLDKFSSALRQLLSGRLYRFLYLFHYGRLDLGGDSFTSRICGLASIVSHALVSKFYWELGNSWASMNEIESCIMVLAAAIPTFSYSALLLFESKAHEIIAGSRSASGNEKIMLTTSDSK